MEYILEMTFVCSNGKTAQLSIDGVKDNLTEAQISSLMDTIITNNIFSNKNGSYVEKAKAIVTERTAKTYNFGE